MIDFGLKNKVALITGGNNPMGIGAAIARALASHGVLVFIHYYRNVVKPPDIQHDPGKAREPGLRFFFEQQQKTAEEVVASIRE